MLVEFVMNVFSVAPGVQCGTETCQGGSVSECPHVGSAVMLEGLEGEGIQVKVEELKVQVQDRGSSSELLKSARAS